MSHCCCSPDFNNNWCNFCGGRGYTSNYDGLPPGVYHLVQYTYKCGACNGTGRLGGYAIPYNLPYYPISQMHPYNIPWYTVTNTTNVTTTSSNITIMPQYPPEPLT
jgi:hypothetical protein